MTTTPNEPCAYPNDWRNEHDHSACMDAPTCGITPAPVENGSLPHLNTALHMAGVETATDEDYGLALWFMDEASNPFNLTAECRRAARRLGLGA